VSDQSGHATTIGNVPEFHRVVERSRGYGVFVNVQTEDEVGVTVELVLEFSGGKVPNFNGFIADADNFSVVDAEGGDGVGVGVFDFDGLRGIEGIQKWPWQKLSISLQIIMPLCILTKGKHKNSPLYKLNGIKTKNKAISKQKPIT